MSDEALKISDALLAANVPYSGFSCNGVNLFGDDKSIKAVRRWMHEAEKWEAAHRQAEGRITALLSNEKSLFREIDGLRDVVVDMLAGLEYLCTTNRIPYGFGIDRLETTGKAVLARKCTCHPDDNPPVPCAKKYALSECRTSAQVEGRS
jgi:hypothetical protein